MQIVQAEPVDYRDILALQRLAYQSEAELLGEQDIPPLRQTLAELQAECRDSLVLKMVEEDGRLVGSVRAFTREGTVYIGKLMVHPQWQGRGLGRALLAELESLFPGHRYTLFTSSKSERNLGFYRRHGYTCYKESPMPGGWSLVYLEKGPKTE